MKRLSEVAAHPSAFDTASNYTGTPFSELDHLYVVLTRNRDSDLLTESNWYCALKTLGGESGSVVIHRFRHWAYGWWEALCVTEERKAEGQAIVDRMENYPILDEDDYSDRQWKEATRVWNELSIPERVELCQRFHCNVLEARHNRIPYSDNGSLFEYLTTP